MSQLHCDQVQRHFEKCQKTCRCKCTGLLHYSFEILTPFFLNRHSTMYYCLSLTLHSLLEDNLPMMMANSCSATMDKHLVNFNNSPSTITPIVTQSQLDDQIMVGTSQ
jgi:hypothetical protein